MNPLIIRVDLSRFETASPDFVREQDIQFEERSILSGQLFSPHIEHLPSSREDGKTPK